DGAGMARRAAPARLRRGARGADGKDDGVFQLGRPPRRDYAAAAAFDAGADDARRRRVARASGQGGGTHLPPQPGRIHRPPRGGGVTNKQFVIRSPFPPPTSEGGPEWGRFAAQTVYAA